MSAPGLIHCPTCHKPGPWWEQPHGPFCSERCRLVDLGRWLNEDYRIAEPLDPEVAAALAEEATAPPHPPGGTDPAEPDSASAR